ncbi:MAG: T9SS C-terminal target domain-containing protein [Calditrichaeota bacterium]|nr:MAG: T9SS C-terminal target domain-containing protein [Calditrichota bacterium]
MRFLKRASQWANQCLLALAIAPLGTVILSWNPSPEADVMGYKVYYGNASGNYTQVLDVGKVTEFTLNNLVENTPYFFAVTAYDTALNESGYSNEVSIVLNGQDPPGGPPSVAQVYNYPNPFHPKQEVTHLHYVLQQPAQVTIEIYDSNNELVRKLLDKSVKAAGEHTEDTWDGRTDAGQPVANGIYFAKIQIGNTAMYIKIAVFN